MTHAEAKPSLYRNVRIHQSARLSPAAGIVGDVTIGRDSCVLALSLIHICLANLLGGYLKSYADYYTNMMQSGMPYTYGDKCNPYDSVYASSMSEAEKSDLVIMFGNSPADTRMGLSLIHI